MHERIFHSRLKVLKIFFGVVFVLFTGKLFSLQVLQHNQFYEEAKAQHQRRSVLPARRGKILVYKNRLSDEITPLATNNTLKMLFVDPVVMSYPKYDPNKPFDEQEPGNPRKVAQSIAPLLIHAHCEKLEGCVVETNPQRWSAAETIAVQAYTQELYEVFTQVEVNRVVLAGNVPESRGQEITALLLPGIRYEDERVIADPTQISDPQVVAEALAPLISAEEDVIARSIRRRPRRYVEIVDKIVPEVSEAIESLRDDPEIGPLMRGIGLQEEHWRYYPERDLAAQVVGFVDNNGHGQYGIEERFDQALRGKEGVIYGAANTRNQFIGSGGLGIRQAEDGQDIVLTIDRVMQGAVQKILEQDVQNYAADSGQVIILDPHTGKILTMAQYPSFDPNGFGRAYERYEITADQEFEERNDELFNQRVPTVRDDEGRYYRYYNTWGPEVFKNKMVTEIYEPGSVVKALTVAAGINADEIGAKSLYEDTGPIEVLDQYVIGNADDIYAGDTSILEGLIKSRNTMIAYLTRKMGAKLVYEYLSNFGFGQYTDIELPGEQRGTLEHWRNWDESELITRGFGQGVSSTALQMAVAFSALANGGYVMEPQIVEAVIDPITGHKEPRQSKIIQRVISEDTYQITKAMLKTSVEDGYAKGARVPGYSVMGKTGTSQTYRNGKAQTGEGTTITSFGGFGPFTDPQWVVLVKYDYPKKSQWGSETAAMTFSRIGSFLMDHYGIPPE